MTHARVDVDVNVWISVGNDPNDEESARANDAGGVCSEPSDLVYVSVTWSEWVNRRAYEV